ncbi:hypothetical protein PG999_012884 [Apiospora kogelbergensis]|uniref:Ankyrin repeat protein n=1 Tax=Apiospora kogelbergensis TaxID=1337665 RepID=A0AAW0Q853_9PEZI
MATTTQDFETTEVEDDLYHFFGTTEFNARAAYFEESNSRWSIPEHDSQQSSVDSRLRVLNKIIKELERVERTRSMIEKESSENHLVKCLEKSRQAWHNSEEYRDGIGVSSQKGGLVNKWSKRDKFDASPRLEFLKKLRDDLGRTNSTVGHTNSHPELSRQLPSRPQRRLSANRVSRSHKRSKHLPATKETNEKAGKTEPNRIAYDPDEDFNAYLIQYEKSTDKFESSQVKSLKPNISIAGNFPDQRVPIRHILGENEVQVPTGNQLRGTVSYRKEPSLPVGNLLKDHEHVGNPPKEPKPIASKIRYFHFPANNMAWAERAIALYYEDDEIPTSPGNMAKPKAAQQSKIHALLRPEYWRGQQQGDRGAPVHARHMRPLCEAISLAADDGATSHPKDVALFMPFLHWETDRKRHTFANFIDTVTTRHRADIDDLKKNIRAQDVRKRNGLQKPARFDQSSMPQEAPSQSSSWHQPKSATNHQGDAKPPVKSIPELVENMNLKKHRLEIDENRRVLAREPDKHYDENQNKLSRYVSNVARAISRKPKNTDKEKDNQNRLGQYLIDAARLYEGITNYRDKKLLDKYLHVNPLFTREEHWSDQAYYWSLNTTQSRDRDQVVYRGTRAAVEKLHQFDIERQIWPKHEEDNEPWMSRHDEDGPCQECQANIRKVSRLIMVDQLWLWVLDEHTILTFFPRRYGTNKNDVTGVHKSIRTRLENVSKTKHPEQQMGSVWDLALIIFDECTNTFFDRTKTTDRQPQIIDDFSEAIGNVTIAFDRLWAWTEQWKANNSKKNKSRTNELQVSLLDINPEGKLQREIKDIIEELEIMIHINRTHKTILKSFIHQVIHIMDPNGQLKNRFSMLKLDDEHTEGSGPAPRTNKTSRKSSGIVNEADYDRFETKAEELLAKVTSRIEELEELRRSAQSTSDSIKDLLALKQQQASVVQAWQAAQQTEETVAQGRSIMMFTVVTIVFAPLSFMTSVFGMNALEFSPENTWKILDEFKYIFEKLLTAIALPVPVSAATILLVLFLAFNPYVRALVKAVHYRISAKLLTKAWGGHSLYKVWYANNNWRSEEQIGRAYNYARKKKDTAREEVLKERREKEAAREEASKERREKSTQANREVQNDHNVVTRNGGSGPVAAAANGTRQDDSVGKQNQGRESQGAIGV